MSNQKDERLFNTRPLSGTSSSKTTSKAEMRSVTTMTIVSPRS